MIKETFQYTICEDTVFPEKAVAKHLTEKHPIIHVELFNDPHTYFKVEFDWLLLKIGHGHFEMTMVCSFFELNWDILKSWGCPINFHLKIKCSDTVIFAVLYSYHYSSQMVNLTNNKLLLIRFSSWPQYMEYESFYIPTPHNPDDGMTRRPSYKVLQGGRATQWAVRLITTDCT